MRPALSRLVDLREGEGIPALKAFVTLFSVIAAHTLLETARDALFLGKLPATRLPLVYVLLAGLAFAVSAQSTAFVHRFGRRNALLFTLVAASYGTALQHFLPRTDASVFGLYLWSGLLGPVLATQFWIFAGQLFTVAQGKRLFGIIGAGGVAGAVAGASAAAAAIPRVAVHSLLLIAAGLFLAAALLLTTLEVTEERPVASLAEKLDPRSAVALFREHPYLRRVALALALSTAATLTTDYLFKSVASHHVPPAELGDFFARTYAVLNAVALVVQLGLAALLVRRLGVMPALMVLPLGLLAGGVGTIAFGGTIALALLTKGADGSLRHSLHRVATELSWMPVPTEARNRGKELVETVFGRGVQALAAGFLLLLSTAGLSSPRVLGGVLCAVSAGWLVVTFTLRRPYLDLFRQALSKGSLESTGDADELDVTSIEAVLEALSSRDPTRVIAAMDLLEERGRARLIPGLILYHESEEVLLRALEIIARTGRQDWIPLAERLFSSTSEAVRVAAVRALAVAGARQALERALEDASYAVRAQAAFSFAHEAQSGDPLRDPRIAAVLAMEGDQGRAAKVALLDAIRDRPSPRWAEVVLALGPSDDPLLVERSTSAMAGIRDARFIPILIGRLCVRDGRGAVRDAIVRQGPEALEALAKALQDPETDARVRLHMPRTISRFNSQRAADLLTDALESTHEGLIRYKALRGLSRVVTGNPKVRADRARVEAALHRNVVEHLRILALWVPLTQEPEVEARGSGRLILGLLEDKLHQSLDRAFRLLQILHRREDIRSVYLALRSEDGTERAQAQEFLDALTAAPKGTPGSARRMTRDLLQLVADDLPAADRVARAGLYVTARPTGYEESLRLLVRERDRSLAALAAYHALELGSAELREEVLAVCRERPSLEQAAPLSASASRAPEQVSDGR